MKLLNNIWKFSRPHTIIGSVIGILTLYLIAKSQIGNTNNMLLFLSLIVGVACNVFIVGINQIADVQIDRINKPYLPIPAGVLSEKEAKNIVYSALIICLSIALYISPYLLLVVALSTFIGWAYSMPPLYFKKHHFTAALSISIVRGVLLNAGGFLIFNHLLNNSWDMPRDVKILTLFVIAFSVVISWFKDLTDISGDAKFNIKTLAIQYSPKHVLIIGNILVGIAYLFTIYMKYNDNLLKPITTNTTLLFGHILLLILFIVNAFSIKLNNHNSVRLYYKRFWWFFFAEYLLYLLAYAQQ